MQHKDMQVQLGYLSGKNKNLIIGHSFSYVRPFYEWAVRDLDP
jgi:hypothetical protein